MMGEGGREDGEMANHGVCNNSAQLIAVAAEDQRSGVSHINSDCWLNSQ